MRATHTGGKSQNGLAPKKAIVLAAGLGTRLRPLTLVRPKPLLPLWNHPLLEHALGLLESWGVEEIAVNMHWLDGQVRDFLEGRRGTARIVISHEPQILGTGGALRPLKEFIGDSPFWLLNADVVARLSCEPLLAEWHPGEDLGVAWLEATKGPRTVEADYQGRITCYASPTPAVSGTYTFCGLQLLTPEIFNYFPQEEFFSIVTAYEAAMMQGHFMRGVEVPDSFWDDAGTPEAYLRLHAAETLSELGLPQADGGVWRDASVELESACHGTNSVLYGGAKLATHSIFENCIIGGGNLGGLLEDVICVSARDLDDQGINQALAALQWPTTAAVELLGKRGSERTLWRLYNGLETAIYVDATTSTRPENRRYGAHAALLSEVMINVPRVLVDQPRAGILVLEDWGNQTLQALMQSSPKQAQAWYARVVCSLARLHVLGREQVLGREAILEPAFDQKLYHWEHELCRTHLLEARYGLSDWPSEVVAELEQVVATMLAQPMVLVHRDCQSSNIMLRDTAFVWIDFQGMRLGAAAYDLASLLYDPYVQLTTPLRQALIEEYCEQFPELAGVASVIHHAAVQRLVQALGAYARLSAAGHKEFAECIVPALHNLIEVAAAAGFEAMVAFAEELIVRENWFGFDQV